MLALINLIIRRTRLAFRTPLASPCSPCSPAPAALIPTRFPALLRDALRARSACGPGGAGGGALPKAGERGSSPRAPAGLRALARRPHRTKGRGPAARPGPALRPLGLGLPPARVPAAPSTRPARPGRPVPAPAPPGAHSGARARGRGVPESGAQRPGASPPPAQQTRRLGRCLRPRPHPDKTNKIAHPTLMSILL